VAVGVAEGTGVAVGGMCVGVKVEVGEGTGDGEGVAVGAGICVQATSITKRRMQKPKRVIIASIIDIDVALVYYRLNDRQIA